MNLEISQEQIELFRDNGFVVVENVLSPDEVEEWRGAVQEAIAQRKGQIYPDAGEATPAVESDAPETDDSGNAAYFSKMFERAFNLWKTSDRVRKLVTAPALGRAACALSGQAAVRLYGDQALFKAPWANPTTFHADTPFRTHYSRDQVNLWVPLDDATVQNGCLYFLPGSHRIVEMRPVAMSPNIDGFFESYPELARIEPCAVPMKAGSMSFHNGLCVHGAGPNMTPRSRRAMTGIFMPADATFNGQKGFVTDEYTMALEAGDPLDDERHHPVVPLS